MSAPTLISNGTSGSDSDVMCLVVRGLDNRVYYRLYDSVHGWGWEDWNVIPNGYTSDSPAAAMLGNELIVVVRGMNSNTLWYTKIRTTDNTSSKAGHLSRARHLQSLSWHLHKTCTARLICLPCSI